MKKDKTDIDGIMFSGADWAQCAADQERFRRITMEMMRDEMLQGRFETSRHAALTTSNKWGQMIPVHNEGVDFSLPGIISSLSNAPERHFTVDFGDQNPFEGRYLGYFQGLHIEEERQDSPWSNRKHTLSCLVSMPTNSPWSVFKGLSRFVDEHHQPQGNRRYAPRGGFLLHLLGNYGWFEGRHTDVLFRADVEAKANLSWQQAHGTSKYSDYAREEDDDGWSLRSTSMHIGPWRFSQDRRIRSGSSQAILRGAGYRDQIIISKESSKQMECIILYLDSTGRGEPLWEAYREDELRSLIGGDHWTQKDLRLLEMLELRNEVFLDKLEEFPILEHIRQVTPGLVSKLTMPWRSKIFNTFGEGTIKIGDSIS